MFLSQVMTRFCVIRTHVMNLFQMDLEQAQKCPHLVHPSDPDLEMEYTMGIGDG